MDGWLGFNGILSTQVAVITLSTVSNLQNTTHQHN